MSLCLYVGIVCQTFMEPQEICPGESPQFNCTVEDSGGLGNTVWRVTVNGTQDNRCALRHAVRNDEAMCGPNDAFESRLNDPVNTTYSSTLTVSSISPNLNGSNVECVGTDGSTICIVGKMVFNV